jgi:lysophospholipase L1-like esterase
VLHILHYGDSQIEGDRITGYIREQMQEKFGGLGAGLAPAIQPIPSMSVSQSASDTISRYIADGNLKQKLDNSHYGILAQMALLDGDVTLTFASRNVKGNYSHARSFSKISLLVGNTYEPFHARLTSGKIDVTKSIEDPTTELQVLTWKLDAPISKFSLHLSGDAEVYGVSMDGGYGVAVDNIPLRGSSGTFFTSISNDLLSSAMKKLNVQLIILEFGGNATAYMTDEKAIASYKNKISKQISYLKRIYPSAKILFIGPADMSKKVNGVLQTYPNLEAVVGCLKEAALENGAAFWSMYDVMGGKNSMIKWVEHQPAWASKDYVHFTQQGATKIAELFVQTFMIYYDYYHFLKRNPQWNANDLIIE